jgi:hypothetical protein
VLCVKCSTKAMVLMDGCMTCLNCGESKCGWVGSRCLSIINNRI